MELLPSFARESPVLAGVAKIASANPDGPRAVLAAVLLGDSGRKHITHSRTPS